MLTIAPAVSSVRNKFSVSRRAASNTDVQQTRAPRDDGTPNRRWVHGRHFSRCLFFLSQVFAPACQEFFHRNTVSTSQQRPHSVQPATSRTAATDFTSADTIRIPSSHGHNEVLDALRLLTLFSEELWGSATRRLVSDGPGRRNGS